MRRSLHRSILLTFRTPLSAGSSRKAFHASAAMASAATSSLLYATSISGPQKNHGTPEDAAQLRHHSPDGKGFINPWESYQERNAWQIIKALLWRRLTGKAKSPHTSPPTVPVHKPSFLPSRETATLRATWLGHACYYVEFPSGFRVLFDPVFTPRCSPFSFMGPKRYTDIPCQISDIKLLDAVVISHNHYDHLSLPTVLKIRELHPNVHFFVPLRNKDWFISAGLNNVMELDWWDSREFTMSGSSAERQSSTNAPTVEQSGVKETEGPRPPQEISAVIKCLPCQHTSARTPFDKSHTLWASWSIESGDQKVWFGGDTGYRSVEELPADVDDYDTRYNFPHCPAFKQIGEYAGPFDLGLIPIGAYDPRWIMSPMHANPLDSVNIFIDTRCRKALGMHWGTWVLTEEDVLEPPKLLEEALTQRYLAPTGIFDVCDIGESREFPKS